jgi:hypothetical protein
VKKIALISALLALPAAMPRAQQSTQVLNLSVIEALAAVDHADLAGVFGFIAERDNAAAFADFLLRDGKAQKKYLAKLEKDLKVGGGLTEWDHAVLQGMVSVYGSPMANLLKKPSAKTILHMAQMASAPVITLEQLSVKRRQA